MPPVMTHRPVPAWQAIALMVVRTGLQEAGWRMPAMREAPVSRIGARPAEIIAHRRAAGLERAGQAAGIGSRRACQWAVLIAGDPARAGDPASAHQAVRTRPLLPALNRSWSCDVSSLRCPCSARLGLRRRPGSRPASARVRGDGLIGWPAPADPR